MLVRDNKYIPEEDKDFFILLRIGLWQKIEEKLSDNPDWEYIYRLATEQTVQGIVADGIGIYLKEHPNIKITEEQNEKFLSVLGSIISRNYVINNFQSKLCQLFDNPSRLKELFPNSKCIDSLSTVSLDPIKYVILKGQTVAEYYPKSLFRVSGDIDFYFSPEEFERAKIFVNAIETIDGMQNSTELHYHTLVNDIELELHGPDTFQVCGKRIENIMLKEFECMISGPRYYYHDSYGNNISIASPEYNTLYIFMHCLKHFFYEGIGIRQFCDLAIYLDSLNLNKFSDLQNSPVISNLFSVLKKMKILHSWRIFFTFLIDWVGLSFGGKTVFFHEPIFKLYELRSTSSIWEMILDSGNMGHHRDMFLEKNFLIRNIHLFFQRIKYSYYCRPISSDIDNLAWIRITKGYLKSIYRRLHVLDN